MTSMLSPCSTLECGMPPKRRGFLPYMMANVDPRSSAIPLTGFCFLTGLLDAVTFSAIFVWCGFQTGNFTQLALAIPRLFEGVIGVDRDMVFHRADEQALTSLLAFNVGGLFGRLGLTIGQKTRMWMFIGTVCQVILTVVAAIVIWKSDEPSIAAGVGMPAWNNTLTFVGLACISASLGLQGVQARHLNTPFGATLVLTTTFVELMSDPNLFKWRHWVLTRDSKIVMATSIFIGGFAGRALVYEIGSAATVGIGAAIRVLIAVSWVLVPAEEDAASDEKT